MIDDTPRAGCRRVHILLVYLLWSFPNGSALNHRQHNIHRAHLQIPAAERLHRNSTPWPPPADGIRKRALYAMSVCRWKQARRSDGLKRPTLHVNNAYQGKCYEGNNPSDCVPTFKRDNKETVLLTASPSSPSQQFVLLINPKNSRHVSEGSEQLKE
jgi:hypothetical protein